MYSAIILLATSTFLGLTFAAPTTQFDTRSAYNPTAGANITFYDSLASANEVRSAFLPGSNCLTFPPAMDLAQVAEIKIVPGKPPGNIRNWKGVSIGVTFHKHAGCNGDESKPMIWSFGKPTWYISMPIDFGGVKMTPGASQ